MTSAHKTAAILVIGNEILSGRTREANAYLAVQRLFERGCKVEEIAVVRDSISQIVAALNRLSRTYDAVITSGGIGPTHDDVTMDAVAATFGIKLVESRKIVQTMKDHYGREGLNEGRRRMARIPKGARLIRCMKTIAPGVSIGNVYVLAGVPDIFASQLGTILSNFGDKPFLRREIDVKLPESMFAHDLEKLQACYPGVEIGSYPSRCGNQPTGKICLSSQDEEMLLTAEVALREVLDQFEKKSG
jgi:molybdenum cofactor synthesis domain-containing protein